MDERFFGHWRITVIGRDSMLSNRFLVSGSDRSDGTYPPDVGTSVEVSGQGWQINMEWSDDGQTWRPSRVRQSASYSAGQGLVRILSADDGDPTTADQDFNDLVLSCRNLDPQLNPRIPADPFFDFIITEDQLRSP
jgi:hypothetical protein